jgi:polysaccharide biosynthesis/export protein
MHPSLSRRFAARILALCASIAVCCVYGQAPGAPAVPTQNVGQPVPPSSVGDQYLIGSGDMLQVFVWRNPELSTTAPVPVRPDGKISTPLVDNMVAQGKTPPQLARDMEKVLAEYVRSPQVTIIITQPMSSLSQVKVVGQVTRPTSIAYHEGITALDAVLAAGGLTQFAAGNRAKIVRMDNGKQLEIHVKLVNLMEKGDMQQNVVMKPGDVLVVPEALF